MELYDKDCKAAAPRQKPYKIFDGQGLYLEVTPKGRKFWRLKYHYLGKEKRLSMGQYPIVTLAEARERCLAAKKLLDQNIDPSADKQERRRAIARNAANTFKTVALEWYENHKDRWTDITAVEVLRLLEAGVFPSIGARPIRDIEVPELLAALRKIEQRGALERLRKTRQICGQVFRYGIQTGRCKENIAIHLKGALKTRKVEHFATIDAREIPELLAAVKNDVRLYGRTRRAIQLSLLTFQRPGEIRQARKIEIDWDNRQWVIPAERMKMRRPHIVPLSCQALEVLREQLDEVKRINTDWMFPCQGKPRKPMSENTVRVALHKLGFRDRMTAHGFRALARTTIREVLDYAPDVIEAQLAHKPSGPLGAAYDRATFLKQRTVMMQAWADYLDGVAATGKVSVPVPAVETVKADGPSSLVRWPQSGGSEAGPYQITYLLPS